MNASCFRKAIHVRYSTYEESELAAGRIRLARLVPKVGGRRVETGGQQLPCPGVLSCRELDSFIRRKRW